jgi:hypothetical protein
MQTIFWINCHCEVFVMQCWLHNLTIWLEPVPSNWWRSFGDKLLCLEMGGSSCNKSTCLDKCDRVFWQFRPIVNKPWAFIVAKTLLVQFTQLMTQFTINTQYNTCVDLNRGIRHPLCPHMNRCLPNSTMLKRNENIFSKTMWPIYWWRLHLIHKKWTLMKLKS